MIHSLQACPRGFRSSNSLSSLSSSSLSSLSSSRGNPSTCIECTDLLTFHDWLYLSFMAILLLLIQWYIIDSSIKRRTLTVDVLLMHLSGVVEVTLAAVTLLISQSEGGYIQIRSCNVEQLSDWYTVFWNPTPDHKETLRCSQEAVYPLYSMVFIFFGLALIFLLIIRPLMARKVSDKNAGKTVYLTMYALPALSLIHAVLGGIICKWDWFVTVS